MRVEPLTCAIGAELSGVNLADAAHDDGLFHEICAAAAPAQGAVPARPGHHPRRPRGLRPPLRRAGGPPGGRQRSGASGPGADLQDARQAQRPLRERLAHRRHLARGAAAGLRAALRGMPARSAATPSGPTWSLAYEKLPEHIKQQIAGLRARHSIEATLRRRHADREAPGAEGAVPGRRAPGGAHASGDRREGAVRQRLHHALHQLPHARSNVRYGQDYAPGAQRPAAAT